MSNFFGYRHLSILNSSVNSLLLKTHLVNKFKNLNTFQKPGLRTFSLSTKKNDSFPTRKNMYSDSEPVKRKEKSPVDREYIFGYASLLPLLTMQRRRVYKLFVLDSVIPKEEPHEGTMSPVEAFLNKKIRKKATQIATDNRREKILALAKEREIELVPVSRARLDQLSEGSPHQGVVARVSSLRLPLLKALGKVDDMKFTYDMLLSNDDTIKGPESNDPTKMPLWVVLDRIVDPHNLGAIIRTAHFFGADGVIITCEESAGPTPTVSKTSAGALEILQVCQVRGLVRFLANSKENGWLVLGTGFTEDSLPMSKLDSKPSQPTLIVLGNEGSGMSPAALEICHHILHIPGHRSEAASVEVGSLNVSVAAGIVINSIRNPYRN